MTIVLGWPQIVLIVLMALNTGIFLIKHGEPRTGTYNIWLHLVDVAILCALMYWGGFFV